MAPRRSSRALLRVACVAATAALAAAQDGLPMPDKPFTTTLSGDGELPAAAAAARMRAARASCSKVCAVRRVPNGRALAPPPPGGPTIGATALGTPGTSTLSLSLLSAYPDVRARACAAAQRHCVPKKGAHDSMRAHARRLRAPCAPR
jgi:hypothetical protein